MSEREIANEISKEIGEAIEEIRKKHPELAKHLDEHIVREGDSFSYTGNINWETQIMTERTIPFGKHKGLAISECPVEYLDWLIGQEWMDDKYSDLKGEIEDYLFSCPEWQSM